MGPPYEKCSTPLTGHTGKRPLCESSQGGPGCKTVDEWAAAALTPLVSARAALPPTAERSRLFSIARMAILRSHALRECTSACVCSVLVRGRAARLVRRQDLFVRDLRASPTVISHQYDRRCCKHCAAGRRSRRQGKPDARAALCPCACPLPHQCIAVKSTVWVGGRRTAATAAGTASAAAHPSPPPQPTVTEYTAPSCRTSSSACQASRCPDQ